MAAIAVRKKVVSIGHFPPTFYPQTLQIYFVCQIKSRAIVCIDDCTENQRKIGLSQMSQMSQNTKNHSTEFLVACLQFYNPLCPSVGPSFKLYFLGSGPEGANDLCFRICRNFSFSFVHPPFQAHILLLRSKSQTLLSSQMKSSRTFQHISLLTFDQSIKNR